MRCPWRSSCSTPTRTNRCPPTGWPRSTGASIVRATRLTRGEAFIRASASPADACPGLAQAYERTGNRKRAIEEFQRCAAADPQEPDFLADLGAAWERAGQHGDALAAYRSAACLDPANPELARRIGELSRVVDTDQ